MWSTSLHRYIRNTPSDTEVHPEHQLRVDRSTWPLEKSIHNHAKLGRTKELGGKTRVSSTGPALSRWWNWSRDPIPTVGQLSESKEKHLRLRKKQLICGSLSGMRTRRSLPQPRQECRSPGRGSGWELEFRNCGAIPGRGLLLTVRDRSRGCEGGDSGGKCLWRKARQPRKQGDTAESHIGDGAITIASLSPPASLRGWTIERLAHQMPDALNYRGPQPGGPLYVPDVPNNREGPQAREPSNCLNRRSCRERLAKEAFWSPATRGSRKDSDGAVTHAVEAVRAPAHLVPPGCPQAKQLHHLHAQLTGAELPQAKKKSCVCVCRVASVVTNSFQPCRLWPARLLCQKGGSPGKNTGTYWPILVTILSRALYFLLP